MDKNKEGLVVKSNNLVQACYHLSLSEQRIILFAIAEIRKLNRSLKPNESVVVRATDYSAMFDVDLSNAYGQMREAETTLFDRKIKVHDTCSITNKPEFGNERWLTKATYVEGEGIIKLWFSPLIQPYIAQLDKYFTRYRIEKIAAMTSVYAIRLYELMLNWGQDFSKHSQEVTIDWLKQTMSLENDYQNRLNNFKKYVLDIAIKQINEHSDLTCSYEQRKTGRTVTHLIFHFAQKAEAKPAKDTQTPPKPKASPTRAKKSAKADPNADRPKPPAVTPLTPATTRSAKERLKGLAEIKKLRAAVGLS